MRFPIWLSLIAAAVVVGIVIVGGLLLVDPARPLIAAAEFSPTTISPNADQVDDVTRFSYEITRSASVSLVFQAEDGTEYAFREDQPRPADEYEVLFSGVVDGYTLPNEDIAGEVLRRLIPNGEYTWTLTAVADDDDEIAEETGTLVVQEADTPLPELVDFTVSPDEFTPNQDGVDDRVMINVFLSKDADLSVYLVDDTGRELPIPPLNDVRQLGEAGLQPYDYDGGVTIGADPPPDGDYLVIAEAQDDEGQVVQRTQTLAIRDGGRPLAEILAQPNGATVTFDSQPYDARFYTTMVEGEDDEPALAPGDLVAPPESPEAFSQLPISMLVGDMLVFRVVIENYGAAPIRTTGPPPGTVYQQDQAAASLGYYEQSGVWRVGIECETVPNYPWRWAIGTEDNLYTEVDPDNGNIYYYLPPGERSVVWGAVRLTNIVEESNPQNCWAGLIHEDVRIANNRVGSREVQLAPAPISADN